MDNDVVKHLMDIKSDVAYIKGSMMGKKTQNKLKKDVQTAKTTSSVNRRLIYYILIALGGGGSAVSALDLLK